MNELGFRFIGTGNAFAPGGLCWNGFLVNGRYLFEAPPQALQGIHHLGVDANEIEGVILSHHHGDHFLGLPFLLLEWKYTRRKTPVHIVGPPRTRELASLICDTVYPGLMHLPYEVIWHESIENEQVTVGDLALRTFAMAHDEQLSGSLGFLATLGGRRFAYTGDSALCDSVFTLATESEVLISECASIDNEVDVHMNLVSDMPKVRAAMAPSATLLLTHLGAGITGAELPNTIVARDYESYRF